MTVTLSPTQALAFDLKALPEGFFDDPYPWMHALRTHAPVQRQPDGSWLLTRYADCLAVYRDPRRFSSDKRQAFKPMFGDSPLFTHHTTSLVFNDPPLHTRVRRIIAGALSPRALSDMEGSVQALVDRLLAALEGQSTVDAIEAFAAAIPVEVIGNLLGVPVEDRGPLRGWSLDILGALEPTLTPEQREAGNHAVEAFCAYLQTLVAQRRANLRDPESDVLSRLIVGEDGETFSEQELLHQVIFLLNAGHETTTNLIGNGLWLLTQWPEQRARLLADPQGLIDTAVEEMLRMESPNQLGNRQATVDTEIGGQVIRAGDYIHLSIAAANRDPARFDDPDRLDLGRKPNRHLAFGQGVHICAGLSVARLEARIALTAFLRRFPAFELTGPPVRSRRARFRGFVSLPLSLSR